MEDTSMTKFYPAAETPFDQPNHVKDCISVLQECRELTSNFIVPDEEAKAIQEVKLAALKRLFVIVSRDEYWAILATVRRETETVC